MPRSIVLGNDRVHVNFDSDYQLRDFYYPNVGMENHSGGHVFRFGLWVDGTMTWASSADWKKSIGYGPSTLVSDVTFTHATLGIELKLADCVDFHEDLFVRRITVRDSTPVSRLPMAIPTTMLMTAVLTFEAVPASAAKGTTIAATVASPTIQPKNSRGRGVVAVRRWATPVATRAATKAVTA
jgi:hypothetical protein